MVSIQRRELITTVDKYTPILYTMNMSKLSINDKVVWTKTPKVSIPDNGQGVVVKIEENKQKLLMVTIQMGEEEKPVKKKRGRKKASSNCFDIPEKIAKSYLQKLGNDGNLEKIE